MLPQKHIVLGIIFALAIYLIFPSVGILNATIIFLSSFLIDVDHYFYYVYKIKKLSPIKAYKWFTKNVKKHRALSKDQKEKTHFGTMTFHGIEPLILLFTLGFFVSNIFYFILVGFTIHLISDLAVEIIYCNRFNKISVVYCFLKSRGLTFIDDL